MYLWGVTADFTSCMIGLCGYAATKERVEGRTTPETTTTMSAATARDDERSGEGVCPCLTWGFVLKRGQCNDPYMQHATARKIGKP